MCGDGDKQAAEGEDDEDDPDPYGGAATSAQAAPAPSAAARQVTSYVYDITAPYYEVLTETTEGATVSYDYGLERLAAHSADFWASRKTEYLYDGRGSVALEYSYNNSWYTLGGALSPGETVSRRYTPFGEPLAGGASPLSRNGMYYGYNGESYDPATGMLNLRARQYEPAQMRFSQAAPLSAQDRLGMLGKCPANPPLEQRKKWPSHLRLSKNPGVDQGPQPLMFHPALTTQGELPRRGKRRPPGGVCVRTDKNPEGFVLCGFCRPGAMREAKPVKVRKSGVQPLFRKSHIFQGVTF